MLHWQWSTFGTMDWSQTIVWTNLQTMYHQNAKKKGLIRILTAAPWWTTQQRPDPIWQKLFQFPKEEPTHIISYNSKSLIFPLYSPFPSPLPLPLKLLYSDLDSTWHLQLRKVCYGIWKCLEGRRGLPLVVLPRQTSMFCLSPPKTTTKTWWLENTLCNRETKM